MMAYIRYEDDVPEYDTFVPSEEQRLAALIADVQRIAPDWTEFTTVELLKTMAKLKVEFMVGPDEWPVSKQGDAA